MQPKSGMMCNMPEEKTMQWVRSALAAFACLVGLWSAAHAQNYPNRPITFVVPFAPGGLSDVPARVLAAMMQEKLTTGNQNVK